ncbi:LAMI_0G12310g1_1 [Lachancea mirantina]|uniref:LAMI_0G12310g1_1 n=1 Tax=Lachancea mirantina TaxID=1230905 RepID=A0A1G4KBC7_9SACH|nr:LAMI_0G12310g1_1 [Lachancea mirantina]
MTSPEVKRALVTLLRDPKNNYCADCKTANHPRWASWSLGVFICIRCAGIHRSLGTHISKVKSVDLDTWQEEHLRKVIEFGNNECANAVYEGKLSGCKVPDASQLGTFIRNKYEHRRWEAPASEARQSRSEPDILEKSAPISQAPRQTTTQSVRRANVNNLSAARVSASSSQLELNLASPQPSTRSISRSDAASDTKANASGRPDLKKSILSLYSRPRSGVSDPGFNSTSPKLPAQTTSQVPASLSNYTPSAVNSSVSSLDDNELFKNVWS